MKKPQAPRTVATSRQAAITAGLWLVLCFSPVIGAQRQENYPGKLGIAKAENLTAEQRAVEARFAAYLEANTEEAIARYIKKFGNEIDTDNAREISADYAPGGMAAEDPATIAARTRWGEAVHEPASALVKEIYRRALMQDTPPNRRRQVLFTAGGAGVGKTTSIRRIAEFSDAVRLQVAEIVYDATMATFGSAIGRIVQALDSGRMVSIVFVYRDPVVSFVDGMLPRARETGRIVPLEVFLSTHLGAVETIVKIAAAFKNNPQVAIVIIDNREGISKARIADPSFAEAMARRYTREELGAKLKLALEEAYEKGRRGDQNGIPENIYREIKGYVQ
ncbi:MAG: zeta toxin family protein [Candidatus Binatia bacterium]